VAATAAVVGVDIHRPETAAGTVVEEAQGILLEAIKAADLSNNFFPQPLRPLDRAGAAFFRSAD
jgi:hypothetical protein